MKYNDERNANKKEEPIYILIGGAAFIVFIVLFCVIVWGVTHKNKDDIVMDNTTVVSSETVSSETTASSDVVETVESSEEESSEEVGLDYNDTSNDMGLTFTEVEDVVTAVDVTNLRSEPSTAQGAETVVAKLRNGTTAVRIGREDVTGWSKLVYDGKIVYASTNYLIVVEEE